jgi:hypothetical protein
MADFQQPRLERLPTLLVGFLVQLTRLEQVVQVGDGGHEFLAFIFTQHIRRLGGRSLLAPQGGICKRQRDKQQGQPADDQENARGGCSAGGGRVC